MIDVFTDGSSLGNPGPSGWACIVDGRLFHGSLPLATNNQAELYAIFQAVLLCPEQSPVLVHTDSKLCVGWLGKGWRMNHAHIRSLVKAIVDIAKKKKLLLFYRYVKGHSGHKENEIVHAFARSEAEGERNRQNLR